MRLHSSKVIENALSLLNSSGIDWILLRNTNDELPGHLDVKKDIDILVRSKDKKAVHDFLLINQFSEIRHPLIDDIRLYGVDAFRKYKSLEGLLIDINFQAVVRSLDQGQWIPLDQSIQKDIWLNKQSVLIGKEHVPMPAIEDLFILTISRCIFDKKDFTIWHRHMLVHTLLQCDLCLLRYKLDLIFFKFSPKLINLVKSGQFDEIIPVYLSFSDY